MKTWVEVENDTIRLVYNTADEYTPPADTAELRYEDLTGTDPMPEAGWTWNGSAYEAPPADPPGDDPDPVVPDPPTLQEVKDEAKRLVDSEAALARVKYTTGIIHQGSVYVLKADQAQAFKDAGYPSGSIDDYPWIKEEADGLGDTYQDTADGILAKRDSWADVLGPAIERERLVGKKNIDDAVDETAVTTAKDAAITALQAI